MFGCVEIDPESGRAQRIKFVAIFLRFMRSPPKARIFGFGFESGGGLEDDVRATQALIWATWKANRTECAALYDGVLDSGMGVVSHNAGDTLRVVDDGQLHFSEDTGSIWVEGPGDGFGFVSLDAVRWKELPPFPASFGEAAEQVDTLVAHAIVGTEDLNEIAATMEYYSLISHRDISTPSTGSSRMGLVANMRAYSGTLVVEQCEDLSATGAGGGTVLIAAVMGGHDVLVGSLLGAIGDDEDLLNAQDDDGSTALWHAAARGDFACLKTLLLHPGVDPNVGKSPLRAVVAVESMDTLRRAKIIELLLVAGAIPPDEFNEMVAALGLSAGSLVAAALPNDGDTETLTVAVGSATVATARASTVSAVEAVDLREPAAETSMGAALRDRLSSRPELSFIDPAEIVVGDMLGAGGFGSVFSATMHGATVVVKTVKDFVVREFLSEVAALVEITHPNALEYMGVSLVGESTAAIVTEYMGGGDLMRRINAEAKLERSDNYASLSYGNRLSILSQVCWCCC